MDSREFVTQDANASEGSAGIYPGVGASVVAYKDLSSSSANKIQSPRSKKDVVADLKQKFAHLSLTLAEIFDEVENIDRLPNTTPEERTALALQQLRKIVTTRKRRNHAFPEHHFADPAWDMILDLTIAMAENRRISVSSLSLAANVPATTGLRCIKQLADEGIILIVADPQDARRKYTRLSEDVYERMIAFGASLPEKYRS